MTGLVTPFSAIRTLDLPLVTDPEGRVVSAALQRGVISSVWEVHIRAEARTNQWYGETGYSVFDLTVDGYPVPYSLVIWLHRDLE